MKSIETLKKLGLSGNRADVYVSLLEISPATISELARKSGIHRPLLYKALPELEKIGLVTSGPRGKLRQYFAEEPTKLSNLFANLENELNELLPQLRSIYRTQDSKPVVKLYTGKNGVSLVFSDVLTTLGRGDVFYRYSSARSIEKNDKYLPKDYREKRDAKRLERFVITSKDASRTKKPRLGRSIKIIPEDYDLFDYDITQLIYADKVAFIDYNTETAIIVENKIFARFQRSLFKLLYSKL